MEVTSFTGSPDGLTHRRAGVQQGSSSFQPAAAAPPEPAAAKPKGTRTWVIWMLFGLGWPSLLFFGLCCLPSISSTVEWWLLISGWVCLTPWWGGFATGVAFGNDVGQLSRRKRQAWKACSAVGAFGTSVGLLLLTSYAYRHWHLLQMLPLAAAVAIIVYSWLNPSCAAVVHADDEADSKPLQLAAAERAADDAAEHPQALPAAASPGGPTAAVGPMVLDEYDTALHNEWQEIQAEDADS